MSRAQRRHHSNRIRENFRQLVRIWGWDVADYDNRRRGNRIARHAEHRQSHQLCKPKWRDSRARLNREVLPSNAWRPKDS